jgi:hypothetical protein
MTPPLPAAAAHPHRPVYRGPSYAMTAVMSLRSSVAPPGHCVPGTPEPPSASAVLVPLHMLLRYDYLAGSLGGGFPLVPDRSACTRYRIPAIPVPVRIRGRSPGRAADSWFLFAPVRTRAVTMLLPVRIRGWSPSRAEGSWASFLLSQTPTTLHCTPYCPWTPGLPCRHFYRCSLLAPKIFPRFSPLLPFFLVYEFVIP